MNLSFLRSRLTLLPTLASLLVALPSTAATYEENWPQWRGPIGSGVGPKANPPLTWSEKEHVKWKVKLPGQGTSSPIVWDDLIFLQTAMETTSSDMSKEAAPSAAPPPGGPPGRRGGGGGMASEKPSRIHQFAVVAIQRNEGKVAWQKIVKESVPHEGHHPDHGFSSYSPVTDGTLVISSFGSRGLYALDMKGNVLWQKDLGQMQTKMGFGEGSSPALHKNTLVVNWDHEGEDFIAAFDKTSGKELWRTPRNEDTTWATPVIAEQGGRTEVITVSPKDIISYDLKDGKQLWKGPGLTANVIPTPIVDHGVLYAISGFRGYMLMAIKLGQQGDITGTDAILWKHTKSTPYVPSPLLYENRLYFFANNNGMISILDKPTGKPLVDAERIESLPGVYSSPVAANGRVYLVGRNGTVVVLKSSDKLEVLATNKLDEAFDASPALAGGDLILRGHEYLYCIGEK
jgi:outer membrane protein assembly factor BamB